MDYDIFVYSRPSTHISRQIVEIASLLTAEWFTANVPEDISRDLLYQDAVCLCVEGRVVCFLQFTCMDGAMHINLMGTHPDYRGQGYGTVLLRYFFRYVKSLGMDSVKLYTVPPDTKPAYLPTLRFYERNGFRIVKRYDELWESGAIEMVKEL